MVGELRREAAMGAVGLCHDEEPARVLVEPVHDPRPLNAADAGEALAAMGDERVDQCAAVMAGGRMDDEPGRLVDHDELLVLMDDAERDRLALRLGRRRSRDFEHDLGARLHPRRGLADHRAGDPDPPVAHQRLQAAARQVAEGARQHPVEPVGGGDAVDLKQARLGFAHGRPD